MVGWVGRGIRESGRRKEDGLKSGEGCSIVLGEAGQVGSDGGGQAGETVDFGLVGGIDGRL